jgi:hypothetical protein
MQAGYWINYVKGKAFRIDEHEMWIRRWENAKKLGISSDLYKEFSEFEVKEDRDEFLMYVLEKAPVMRMRGHGATYAFEFNTRRTKKPLDSVWEFGMDYAGDYTNMYIVNFATKETVQMLYKEFNELMMNGREDAVLRVAKTFKVRRGSQDMRSILGKENVKPLVRKQLK